MASALGPRARVRPRGRAPVNWWSRGELRAKFLCFSFLRREALWPGSAALLLLQRRIPLLLQRQPRCKLALCCLCLFVLGWDSGPSPAQSLRHPRDESRTTLHNDQQPRGTHPLTRGFSGILSLELCVRLLRCCVSALISAVCSTTLSCTADPVAGADLLRCSRYKGA